MRGTERPTTTAPDAALGLEAGVLERIPWPAPPRLPTIEGDRAYLHGVSIADFRGEDAATVRALYDFLDELHGVARAVYCDGADGGLIGALLRRRGYSERLAPRVTELGVGLEREGLSLALRQAYHDLRGGSYSPLSLVLPIVEEGDELPGDHERIYLLTRDHLKIMRSAVHDLDPERSAADLQPLHHRVDLLGEKWADVDYAIAGAKARIRYLCGFVGSIAECCVEFAALDRVLYNLINNAVRFAADEVVAVRVDPLAAAIPGGDEALIHVRFAVINRISVAQRSALLDRFGGADLGELFVGGFTTGGHGVGLRICAELVAHGYHLGELAEGARSGLVGARLVDDHFVAWFHWPGRREGGPTPGTPGG